jgi:hypothetical protein
MGQKKKGKVVGELFQNLKLFLCMRYGKTEEFINNSMKTKTTSKVKKWKGKTHGGYAHSLSKHIIN